MHKQAFEKAWDIRNFEIEKFWHRSAHFWVFIALIFTGYFIAITSESKSTAQEMYLDLYLILLGLIFSVGWLLVICGSKRWQENWEKHIDKLENNITGPLYKTVYYKGNTFYSVSKISQILAIVVIVVWGFLLIRYFFDNFKFFKNALECISKNCEFILFVIVPIAFTIIFTVILFPMFAKTSGSGYKTQEKGEFFDRYENESEESNNVQKRENCEN